MGNADEPMTRCAQCHGELPVDAAFCQRCGASRTPSTAATPELDGYTILRTLGLGGAATVYLARQESLDREVAVKVIRRHVEDERMWRHFRREARTIARLSGHPNVVTVYTAGRSEAGLPYLVTEYLDRGSLGDVIAAEGPLPAVVVATVGVAVADALAAAHGLEILHRDVKPGNVLLGQDGRVKLGDFGIARLLAGQTLNTTDVIAFTPEHVAPEILRGEPDGPWSDLYGLGSTLATALVGASPFEKRPEERMEALLARKIMAPPPVLPASVPAALAEPVTAALDPDPSRRPSLGELRQRLAAAADALGAAAPTRPSTPATTAPTVRATAPPAHDDARPEPLIGTLRRPHLRPMAIPALLLVLAAALVVALVAGDGGDGGGGGGDGAGGTTSPIAAVPTADGSTAQSVPATSTGDQAAPRTDPAPATTLPATTTVATSAPPTSPSVTSETGDDSVVVTAPQAEMFVRSYYDAVAAGSYERSWSLLAPEFQQGKAQSYEYYAGFWDDNDVEVGDVELVDADHDQAIVNVELRWNGSTTTVTDQFSLRPGEGGELLIAGQDTID